MIPEIIYKPLLRVYNTKYRIIAIYLGDIIFLTAVFVAAASYFRQIYLSNYPYVEPLLWSYIIITAALIAPFSTIERTTRVSVDFCPLCKVPFEIAPKYRCPVCGSVIEKKL